MKQNSKIETLHHNTVEKSVTAEQQTENLPLTNKLKKRATNNR